MKKFEDWWYNQIEPHKHDEASAERAWEAAEKSMIKRFQTIIDKSEGDWDFIVWAFEKIKKSVDE